MEIQRCLRPVDLVENKCIGIVFSRREVKRLHAGLRPHQGQILACGLDKLRAALWLNSCFDQHDHRFVRHIGLLLSIFIGRRFTACSARSDKCSAHALATISTTTVTTRVVFSRWGGIRIPVKPCGLLYGMLALVTWSSEPSGWTA